MFIAINEFVKYCIVILFFNFNNWIDRKYYNGVNTKLIQFIFNIRYINELYHTIYICIYIYIYIYNY